MCIHWWMGILSLGSVGKVRRLNRSVSLVSVSYISSSAGRPGFCHSLVATPSSSDHLLGS
jgi:hypothetical protein